MYRWSCGNIQSNNLAIGNIIGYNKYWNIFIIQPYLIAAPNGSDDNTACGNISPNTNTNVTDIIIANHPATNSSRKIDTNKKYKNYQIRAKFKKKNVSCKKDVFKKHLFEVARGALDGKWGSLEGWVFGFLFVKLP